MRSINTNQFKKEEDCVYVLEIAEVCNGRLFY